MRVILASSSVWRKQLLKKIVKDFDVVAPEVDENLNEPDDVRYVEELSRRKAEAVAQEIDFGVVIGADTIATINGHRLGKPDDEQHAYEIHRMLQGNTHRVLTGLTVIDASTGKRITEHVITTVKMKPYTDDDVRPYIETGAPLKCAAAYAIQDQNRSFVKFVEKIEGDFYSIAGLPLTRLREILEDFGVETCELSS